jgi:hypothetical protein
MGELKVKPSSTVSELYLLRYNNSGKGTPSKTEASRRGQIGLINRRVNPSDAEMDFDKTLTEHLNSINVAPAITGSPYLSQIINTLEDVNQQIVTIPQRIFSKISTKKSERKFNDAVLKKLTLEMNGVLELMLAFIKQLEVAVAYKPDDDTVAIIQQLNALNDELLDASVLNRTNMPLSLFERVVKSCQDMSELVTDLTQQLYEMAKARTAKPAGQGGYRNTN